MDKDEWLKIWADKVFDELDLSIDEFSRDALDYKNIMEILNNIYDIGFEAGKDAEKLERQLQQHGAPVGIGN
jgi:hypothetical protein